MSLYSGGTAYQPKKRRRGISGAKAPVGRQLSRKVQSGAITGKEARQTAYEREVLARAFGPDWRQKVFGKGGAKGIDGSFAPAQIRQKRSQALLKARAKLGGGLGGAKGVQGTFNAPRPRGIGPRKTRKRKLPY